MYEDVFQLDIKKPERRKLLPTAMVRIQNGLNEFGPVRALIDTGAQPNLVSYIM